MLAFFAYLFLAVSLLTAYWFMLLPLLRARPSWVDFYCVSDSRWAAFWLKLDTIKTKLLAALLIIASGLIEMHDFLLPLITGADLTPITSQVPAWVWPIASMGVAALFFWLRKITAASQDKKLIAVETGVVTAEQVISGTDAHADAAVRAMPEPAIVSAEKE